MKLSLAVHSRDTFDHVCCVSAITARVHLHSATYGPRDCPQKLQPRNACRRRLPGHRRVKHRSACAYPVTIEDLDLHERPAQFDRDTCEPAIPNDQVRAHAQRDDGSLCRKVREELLQVFPVRRLKQPLRRTTDAQPGQGCEGPVRSQVSTRHWQAMFRHAPAPNRPNRLSNRAIPQPPQITI